MAKRHSNNLSPDWLVRLVADVEAPPLELDDVSFLQALQTRIPQHLLLQLRERERRSRRRACRNGNRNGELHTLHTHLAVFVDVLFEVVVFGEDGLSDERLVVDADDGQHRGAAGFSQPGDLRRLLVVLVVQIQTSLHGRHLTVRRSE